MLEIKWTNLERVLGEYADAFIERARQTMESNGTNASHNLSDTMEKIIEIGEDWYKVSISLADYWKYVEEGRGPGKFPPPPAIRSWIEVKPVQPREINGRTPTIDQLTYLIGRKISREGTEAQPFFEPTKEEINTEWEDKIDEAISQDVMAFIDEKVEQMMRTVFGK